MKYRQITKATRPHEGEVVGRAEPERLGGGARKICQPPQYFLWLGPSICDAFQSDFRIRLASWVTDGGQYDDFSGPPG